MTFQPRNFSFPCTILHGMTDGEKDISNKKVYLLLKICICNVCYDYGFISAKINSPYFGIESDMVC